jgi:hypothetical protein
MGRGRDLPPVGRGAEELVAEPDVPAGLLTGVIAVLIQPRITFSEG